jgi:hypothetical protein
LGQYGHFGIGKETIVGTRVDPTTFYKVDDYTPKVSIDKIKPETVGGSATASGRSLAMILPGKQTYGASVKGMLWIEGFGHFLMGALGTLSTAGAGDPYTHTFTGESTGLPKSYTLQGNVAGGTPTIYEVCGARINKLEMACSAGGVATFSADFLAMSEATHAVVTASYSVIDPITWPNISYSLAGAADLDIEAWSLSIENNIEHHYAAATNAPAGTIANRRIISGRFTRAYDTASYLTALTANTTFAIIITMVGPISSPGGKTRNLVITIPQAYVVDDPRPGLKPGRLVQEISWQAAYNAVATNDGSFVLTDGNANAIYV